MASIFKERRGGNTYYRLQFYDKDNRDRSMRLGTINKKKPKTWFIPAFPACTKYPQGESNPCCRTENPES
jgi:hypothetical protein